MIELVWLLCVVICSGVAHYKGRSAVGWGILGLIFGIFAIPFVIGAKTGQELAVLRYAQKLEQDQRQYEYATALAALPPKSEKEKALDAQVKWVFFGLVAVIVAAAALLNAGVSPILFVIGLFGVIIGGALLFSKDGFNMKGAV